MLLTSVDISLSFFMHHAHGRYLEIQVHGEIRFDRDVEMLVAHPSEAVPDTKKWLGVFKKKFKCPVYTFIEGTFLPSSKVRLQ